MRRRRGDYLHGIHYTTTEEKLFRYIVPRIRKEREGTKGDKIRVDQQIYSSENGVNPDTGLYVDIMQPSENIKRTAEGASKSHRLSSMAMIFTSYVS